MHTHMKGQKRKCPEITHSVETSNQGYRNPALLVHLLPQENILAQIFSTAWKKKNEKEILA